MFNNIILVPSVVQVVAIIHEDVTEADHIEHLKNVCKTHIHVQSTINPFILNLRLEHKRSNGKCVVQVIIIQYIVIYIYWTYFNRILLNYLETKGRIKIGL